MCKKLLLAIAILFMMPAKAQTKEEVLAEGWLMYYSERASWQGTDIFMAKFPKKKNKIGGYLSYTDAATKTHKCIFFDKDKDPGVLATISFDDSFQVESAIINTDDRKLTPEEKELYSIRENALAEVNSDKSGFFQAYANTNYNLIPLIIKGEKKVYILTGPTNNGVVIFGNDYLLTFDNKNKLASKKKIHKSFLPVQFGNGQIVKSGMHSHVESTGVLITPTDICTLLLYSPYIGWDTYSVLSKDFVSVWDCKKEELTVLTKEEWNKKNDEEDKEGTKP